MSGRKTVWIPIEAEHDFVSRYAALFAGSPTAPKILDSDQEDIQGQHFFKRITAMLKKENFVKGRTWNL